MSKEKVIENVEVMENVSVDVQDNVPVDTQETVKELPKIIFEEFKERVTFKHYIPLSDKNAIIDLVWKNCIVKDEENGIYYIDSIMRDIALHFAVLRYYTNFYEVYEYAEDYSYDELAEAGIFYRIEYENNDMNLITDVIHFDFNDRIKAMNSIGSTLHRLLNGVLGNMPDMNKLGELMQEFSKVVGNVDPKVIEMLGKDFKNGTV
jgi:hypothetical protein